jgi:hypothetical protein
MLSSSSPLFLSSFLPLVDPNILPSAIFSSTQLDKKIWKEIITSFRQGPVNLFWSSPAQSFLVSGPVGTHDHTLLFPDFYMF